MGSILIKEKIGCATGKSKSLLGHIHIIMILSFNLW